VTSGAVAVLLQANPNLKWRDVKYILAATADQVDNTASTTLTSCGNPVAASWASWTTSNSAAAPLHFHPWYGFGKINLDAAVTMAKTSWTVNGFGTPTPANSWTDTGYLPSPSTITTGGTGAIPDCNATGRTTTAYPTTGIATSISFIEAVQVNVCIRHPNIGQLQFELINKDTGDVAVILPGQNGFNGIGVTSTACQLFLVNQFYGTSAASGFQLAAKDTVAGGTGSLDGWQIRIWGH
jgi:subtilisin-like proprotein convertase family protein